MNFKELKLIPQILKAVEKKGYKNPTPIQAQSIPAILSRRDILGCAQTGTGKTAAFAIPTIQLLVKDQTSRSQNQKRAIKSLIITPTRELALQIDESFAAYGKFTSLRHTVIFGGVKPHGQIRALKKGVDVLVATPGRLLDLMNQGYINLKDLSIFTLDEADRMLDMGFINDVKKVIAALPKKKQSLFFSATMAPEILRLANSLLQNPVQVEVTPVSSTAEKVEQGFYLVDKQNKRSLLIHLLKEEDIDSALVFTRTKYGADKVKRYISRAGIPAEAIHGNKSQNARQNALKNFKSRKTKVLVATDIAARGIDINELSHVINFEIPNEPETYVHRIGRTGRANAAGIALSLCDHEEKKHFRSIRRLTKQTIPIVEDHPFPMEDPSFSDEPERTEKRRFRPRGRGGRSRNPQNKNRTQKGHYSRNNRSRKFGKK